MDHGRLHVAFWHLQLLRHQQRGTKAGAQAISRQHSNARKRASYLNACWRQLKRQIRETYLSGQYMNEFTPATLDIANAWLDPEASYFSLSLHTRAHEHTHTHAHAHAHAHTHTPTHPHTHPPTHTHTHTHRGDVDGQRQALEASPAARFIIYCSNYIYIVTYIFAARFIIYYSHYMHAICIIITNSFMLKTARKCQARSSVCV